MSLLSVDPGLNGCGAAYWTDDSKLAWATYVKNPNKDGEWYAMTAAVVTLCPEATSLTIEVPQVYVRTRAKGDSNDLISLAVLCGCFIAHFGGDFTYKVYKPFDWKGQVPKDIMEERTRVKLAPEEMARIKMPPKSLAHNMWDAVALGLHHLKR